MSEARALLEAALEGTIGVHRRLGVSYADMFAATKEGAELIRRADRPEARVAVEGRCCALEDSHPFHQPGHSTFLHRYSPAPRPPEPDRTAALVEALRRIAVMSPHSPAYWAVLLASTTLADLAATPDEAP